MNYLLHLSILFTLYACILLSTSLMAGLTNLITLAQAAFIGMGAYIGVWLMKGLGLPFILAIPIVLILTGITGLLLSLASVRLKGDYYILATIGFQSLVFSFLYNCDSITKGPMGIVGISLPSVFQSASHSYLYSGLVIGIAFVVFSVLSTLLVLRSPFGRVLKGIRENETTMLTLGRNPVTNKAIICFISSGLAGIAGIFYAGYIGYIDPTNFKLDFSVFILTAAIIGGMGNLTGPLAGSLFIVAVPEALRLLGLQVSHAANIQQIIYGLILIALMRFRPRGIAGEKSF
ncbi:MAG: branched-chain amino acid ABC transporter permease [Kiritimatiellae bacterium]|nr:branched-chain amino acid ABC transporter permease [Kiritimatiellia bacterium]